MNSLLPSTQKQQHKQNRQCKLKQLDNCIYGVVVVDVVVNFVLFDRRHVYINSYVLLAMLLKKVKLNSHSKTNYAIK